MKKHYTNINNDWWPVSGRFVPTALEIAVGAVLTQNTNWHNVEKALQKMVDARLTSAEKISDAEIKTIEKTVKPSGFYRQKAKRVKNLANFLNNKQFKNISRDDLLKINGIGRETADSIMLYAFNKKHFVIDAYTRRVFSRLGIIEGDEDYDELKALFEHNIEKNTKTYKEFHALIVEHAKNVCKKKPKCGECFFRNKCFYSQSCNLNVIEIKKLYSI